MHARQAQGIWQFKVETNQFRCTLTFNRGFQTAQFGHRNHLQSGANPLNQHGEGVAHQGVVVNDVNGHGVLKNET
jgi:hypothetical protein